MKQVNIKKNGLITHSANFDNLDELNSWVKTHSDMGSFGKPEHKVTIVTQISPQVLDADGNEIVAEVNESREEIIPCEFSVEIKDITSELEQAKINEESLAYLASTDWYTIRQLEQGIPVPQEIIDARQLARERIVK